MPRTRRLSPRHWTRRFRFWTTLRSVKKPSGSPWGTIRSLLPHGPFSSAFWAGIALTHDVLLVLGLVIVSGTELNVIHIGALLTGAGYSINDKIIVFDRIREFLRFSDPNESASQIMNEAINQTLSRTILTSLSTLAVLVCLYFFGGPSMEDFAWTISAGILIGTYSSIFIASPAALFFSRKHGLHEEVRQAIKAGA